MAERTLTAMYDTRGAAEAARDQLVALGIPSASGTIRGTDAGTTATSAPTADEDKGFWASLADLFAPEEDRHTYAEGLRRGGHLLSARVPEGLEDRAIDLLENSGAVDVDERAEGWRQGGWTGHQAGAASVSGSAATAGVTSTARAGGAADTAGYGSSTGTAGSGGTGTSHDFGTGSAHAGVGERVAGTASDAEATGLEREDYAEERHGAGTVAYADTAGTAATGTVAAGSATTGLGLAGTSATRDVAEGGVVERAEEQLRVGKREVGRGTVRVRSYVVERPVEEQVNLRQERVEIERRPVDRPVEPGDAVFREKVIEASERGEEAVVSKQARVVEEVGIRKDVETRTETVRDTVRQQEVEVEDNRTDRGAGVVREERALGTDERVATERDRTGR
jgi:uncharacterized protein (TIGR02271 family)